MIARGSMNKSDFFGSFTVNMSAIIILFFDLNSWSLKSPNVHTSSTCEITDNMSQLLQIIGQIVTLL